MYYGGFSYSEAYSLPIPERIWFIHRIIAEVNKSQEGGEPDNVSSHSPPMFKNMSPEMQTLMKQRVGAPNKLQRP
ncbi:hypothetical protein CMI47_11855 [Candidatus Pacearchaeota archaeon]|nr:hypothetical protein [Candidatus Pacearchaeota archaeon]|tara:strand:- start:2816 stop:3040 length:225 start_codon:yes stop_codon:yes gene_type:complete